MNYSKKSFKWGNWKLKKMFNLNKIKNLLKI